MGDLARWSESQHPRDEQGRFTDAGAFDALRKIEDEVRSLDADGKLDRASFDRLYAKGLKACGGHRQHLVTMLMYRPA